MIINKKKNNPYIFSVRKEKLRHDFVEEMPFYVTLFTTEKLE